MATLESLRFAAMGTEALIAVNGGPDAMGRTLRRRVEQLEQRWSRFRADSEICALNANPGEGTAVSIDTVELVSRACEGWELSGGAYDPTVLGAVVANGYDRTFVEIGPGPVGTEALASPGCTGIEVDASTNTVWLPEGVGIDPGGIGKGLAADIVVREAMAGGAAGVLVNLGGDLRVAGDPGGGGCWLIEVTEPGLAGRPLARLALDEGAVATTTDRRRRWRGLRGHRHHIIDPGSGSSATTGRALVSAVAAEGWWAEVAATWLYVAGPADGPAHVAALVFDDDLARHRIGPIERYLR